MRRKTEKEEEEVEKSAKQNIIHATRCRRKKYQKNVQQQKQ